MNPFDNLIKKNPFDSFGSSAKSTPAIIKKDSKIKQDPSALGVFANTISGLPQAAVDVPKKFIAGGVKGLFAPQVPATYEEALKTGLEYRNKNLQEQLKDPESAAFAFSGSMQNVGNNFVKGAVRDIGEAFAPNTERALSTQIAERAPSTEVNAPAMAQGLFAPKESPQQPVQQVQSTVSPIKTSPEAVQKPQKTALQQQILDARRAEEQRLINEGTDQLPEEFPQQAQEVRDAVKNSTITERIPELKDIGNTKKQLRDITRNTKEVFGPDFAKIDEAVLTPFNEAKGAYIDTMNNEIESLKKNVIDPLKLTKGSKVDKAIQEYGEGKKTVQELVSEFGSDKAQKIINAEQYFRQAYDRHLDELNKVEKQIYPNNPAKWTPKRADYFRHFHELSSDVSKLQNIIENPIHIDPMLVGKSESTQPKMKWASIRQARKGNKTDTSALGGYLNYLPSWASAVHIDPHIGKFRELADTLALNTKDSKNLNNYIYSVRKFADQLAGKTNDLDRIVTEVIPGGRSTLQAVNWLNNRVKANTILYNMSSTIAQIYNVPQGVASAGPINSARGLSKTLGQIFVDNPEMKKSTFIKERFFNSFSQFDKGLLNNTKKFGTWMVSVLDEVGTKFIWNSQYEKAISEGSKNPIKFADDATKALVSGRGIGEKPLIQNSKVFQIIAPFQLELTNLWWVMEDMAKSDKSIMKKFGQFAALFIALNVLNDGTEKLTGNRLALDPIKAIEDGIAILKADSSPKGFIKAAGRGIGEVISNMPLGQTAAQIYPEYGTSVFGVKTPTRKEFFGQADPGRYGSGLLATKSLQDPLFKILPPFGGSQIKKTLIGLKTIGEGKSTDSSGRWQYKVEKTPSNYIKAGLFGKGATPESQKYYNKKNAPKKASSKKNPFD